MKTQSLILMLGCSLALQAQLRNDDVYKAVETDQAFTRNEIRIPGFDGYQTLKCDFHIHTIFSDGKVWPDIRVAEAWQEGLDAIAITDHIEYRPHKNYLQGDLNESYKIAKKEGDKLGFIVIKGTEITRKKPLGHLNALFISDAEKMKVKDPLKAVDEAISQNAFIMWNHPGWPDDKCTRYPVHDDLIAQKKIHGIEVFNHKEYYPASFDWCRDLNLAFMGNTDVHTLTSHDYGTPSANRPMTLVFAQEKSEKGISDALFAGRSMAYFNGQLAGREEHLKGLLKASLKIRPVNDKYVEITNDSDIPYTATGGGNTYFFPAGKTVRIALPTADTVFTVENCHTGKDGKLTVRRTDFNY